MSQRCTLPQHSCTTHCPVCSNPIAAEIEVSQQCSLRKHAVTHVPMHALSLLIALLEGGNSCVQRAIGDYFKSHKRSSFIRVAHETLLDSMLPNIPSA